MNIYLEKEDIENYLSNQSNIINKMIENLDANWPHYDVVKKTIGRIPA